jgi:hypothetical protein
MTDLLDIASGAIDGVVKATKSAASDAEGATKDATDNAQEKEGTVEDLRKMANDYYVPMTETTLKNIAAGGLDGAKMSAFEDHMKNTAAGMFPTWAKQIAGGMKPVNLLDPYTQMAKAKLGDQLQPNYLTDPKWKAALTGGRDANGNPAPMNLNEWNEHLQTDPGFGWDHTPEAINHAHQMMQKLGAKLGVGQ